ncbi:MULTISPECIES: hypothetical protein [unclassified Streptomyces]|jgi:hypothetical protein|uniref:hypothetical protein n=1 Tax=unclassified Streptomyces TaxID=2593676 RepID=UPI000D3B7217|nr:MULTISPECIES: hypothetical protein [unclassified Streptomyces]PTM91198.1 hypothetical protein C7821_111173 [Streptomyces sp. VMFN-G11Ma]
MTDLRLEDTIFQDLRKTFASISDRMETAHRTLKGTDASAVGESELIDGVHDFAGDWAYGIRQLGKHTQGVVKMINKIGDSFGRLDFDLAESLKSPKQKGK